MKTSKKKCNRAVSPVGTRVDWKMNLFLEDEQRIEKFMSINTREQGRSIFYWAGDVKHHTYHDNYTTNVYANSCFTNMVKETGTYIENVSIEVTIYAYYVHTFLSCIFKFFINAYRFAV